MDEQDQERHDVKRMMRRAAELGHDPDRVARAVGHLAPPADALDRLVQDGPATWRGARALRRFARRAAPGAPQRSTATPD